MEKKIREERKQSISNKILLILMTMVLMITLVIGGYSVVKHRQEIIGLKAREAEQVGALTASGIDVDSFSRLAGTDSTDPYYRQLKATLAQYKEASKVKYLYAVVPDTVENKIRYIAEGQATWDNAADIYDNNFLVEYADFFQSPDQIDEFMAAFENGETYVVGMYEDPDFGRLMTICVPIKGVDGKTVGMVGVDLNADDVINEANQLMYLVIGIAVVGVLAMAFISSILIRRIIVRPLKKIVEAADSLAMGDVSVNVKAESNDEIGQMSAAFQRMIENVRAQANAARKIAEGDLSVELEPKSEKDVLSISMKSVVQELRKLVSEMDMLTDSALDGNLGARGDAEAFSGGYREIISGVNATLDAVIGPLNVAASYMDRISKGDIPPEITDEYKGDFELIKNNINTCINAVNDLVDDMNGLSMSAIEGQLTARADAGRHSGDFAKVVSGVNATLDAVIGPLQTAAAYIDMIGKGEIPEKITEHYNGDFNTIKNDINACIDGLGGLVEGRDVLGRMARNDYSKRVEGEYLGVFKEIAVSISSVTDVLNDFIRILTKVSNGDLSDLEYLKSLKDIDENDRLVPSTIAMIEIIKELVGETRMLADAAVEGTLSTRGDAAKFKGEFASVISGVNATLDAVIEPVNEAREVLQEMAKGNLQINMSGAYKGDHAELKNALNETIGSLVSYVGEISAVLSEIGAGNLRQEITADYKGDFISIKDALNSIITSLNEVLGDINDAADQVASGSRQVSDGSQALSQGATEQASSIEELTASITQIASQTKQNAINANQASELATTAKDNAVKGDGQMKEMLNSMADISDSSANISKIIKVIDDIAFQTNILALNAAVEAARAGQHGKGFAVVAEEVRNLAARSANAARETTDLIEGSIAKVQHGTKIAQETADALNEIVDGVEKAANLVGEIAAASSEQAGGIAQIDKGIEQVSQVIQTNSATAEESAAASEELSSQAELLKQMVSRFNLKKRQARLADDVPALAGSEPRMLPGDVSSKAHSAGKSGSKPKIALTDEGFDKY